jgi:hypothetical protein
LVKKHSKIFKGDIYCDEKGLIFEAYNIENIDIVSCKIIFFDWLISLKPSMSQTDAINELLKSYSPRFPSHPMTKLLTEGINGNLGIRPRKRARRTKRAI